ncbi:ATP12-domain-containing protein [Trametes sanguinea]|nr:ATP12-domain-containing protein [Trametes sanguinea]
MHRQAARALVPLLRADARTPLTTRRVVCLTRGLATAPKGHPNSRKGRANAPKRQPTAPKEHPTTPKGHPTPPKENATTSKKHSTTPKGNATASKKETPTTPNEHPPTPKGNATAPEEKATAPKGNATAPEEKATAPKGNASARKGRSKKQTSVPYKPTYLTEEDYKERCTKRFWKTVGIENQDGGYVITLDGRPLKTLTTKTLIVPPEKRLVAALIASEWENQDTVRKPHALPVTSIAGRAFDDFQDPNTRGIIRSQLMKYLETDSIFYHADEPAGLVRLQEAHWKPIIDWAQETFEVEIKVSDSLVVPPQSPETMKKFKRILTTLTPAELAAMERATYASKSFLIGLALVMRHLDVEQAAQAAHVEVNSQIERWGEVEDSHDVDYHDMRRQLGSAACLLVNC